MPSEDHGMTLQGIIANVAGGQQLQEPVNALQLAARNLAAAMYNDPQWEAVQPAGGRAHHPDHREHGGVHGAYDAGTGAAALSLWYAVARNMWKKD
jgi:hypothetical protein